jgi:CheY-like chemotaxis protein
LLKAQQGSTHTLSEQYLGPLWIEHGYGTRFQGFQNLMRRRIRDVLLVSSLYDLYFFEKDGRLYELIRKEYQALDLTHSPEFTRVSSGSEAIALAKEERRFDLIITTLHIEDMSAIKLARLVREAGLDLPIVLLACDSRELKDIAAHLDTSVFDRIFIWQGDFRLMIGIIKHLEDRMNVDHDTRLVGVQSIILIEDNVRFYSYFLPVIYAEILTQSHRLISDGINLSHRYLRTRARPKILLCETYEEAWQYFDKYSDYILGIISDIVFPRNGVLDPRAGFTFTRQARERFPHLPILLQSIAPEYESEAKALAVSFLLKDSPAALLKLRQFTTDYFSFGDFIFRTPDGHEVGRASDLNSLKEQLQIVPDESIVHHAERNDFSNWLKARTEFLLAYKVRPRKVSDYPSVSGLRQDLIASLGEYRRQQQRGVIADFSKEAFDPENSFARIGGGSLGGKARGLGFVNILINNYDLHDKFEGIRISVPPAVVLGTEVFDQFLDENSLRSFALKSKDDAEITRRFLAARSFPEEILGDLAAFLDLVSEPLAVRSSSLLEDSQYHPFAGVYETYMIPNNHSDPFVRLGHLVHTIKRVYASTFYQSAKDYIKATAYHLEEEKMAVVIQRIVGAQHQHRFYPDISGVAKSYNFYPVSPEKPFDGIVAVSLGLGKQIVDGGVSVRFCPKYPNHLLQFSSAAEALRNNQHDFFALDLKGQPLEGRNTADELVQKYELNVAEMDNTLQYVASTYLPENDALYDGLSRKGLRVVTFAPILRNKIFPLPKILTLLLDMGCWGMGTPVEIEFAITMSAPAGKPREFGLLQMRPLVLSQEVEHLEVEDTNPAELICLSNQVLGHGIINNIFDIVVVDAERFERSRSQDAALEVAQFNEKLSSEGRRYLLIGVGRWGSLDPWLGIPVRWDRISGAKAIVETSFKDLDVDPSQGSHFFQNVTSFMVGYFTVNPRIGPSFIDWDWLRNQGAAEEKQFTRHIRLNRSLTIKIDGQQNKGIILKPE